MAVFLLNICKFNGCGITFPSLGDLIQHIEDTHIDYDPKVVEQKELAQPACLPLSYVLRFISEDARKEGPFLTGHGAGADLKRKLAIKHHSYSMSSSNRSNTPTGSEMDDDEMVVSESEDSNDSWTTEEFSSEFIMRYGSRHSGSGSNGTPGNEKPFACPVPGCKKRYKNVNGIKYHSKNGHKKDGKVRKGYKCHCGKSYKTAQGLKSHALVAHNSSPENVLVTQSINNVLAAHNSGVLMQRSSSPSQSLGSLSPSSISNMSSGASSCHGSAGGGGSGSGSGNGGGSGSGVGSGGLVSGAGGNNAVPNLLQHFSNSNHSSSSQSTVNCIVQAIGGGTLSLQQQPQYNTTANNNHPHVVAATVTSATLPAAVVPSVTSIANSTSTESSTSFSFSGQLLATAMQQQQQRCSFASANGGAVGAGGGAGGAVISVGGSGGGGGGGVVNNGGNCFYAATAPFMQQTSVLPYTASTAVNGPTYGPQQTQQVQPQLQPQPQAQPQPLTISPTFIEHKYSANTFKEKFFANLRQNQQNVTNKLKSLNSTVVDHSKGSTMTADHGSITNDTSNVKNRSLETEDEGIENKNNNSNNRNGRGKDGAAVGRGILNGSVESGAAHDVAGAGNPEKCSIQQQLNEAMKNNTMFKKSIN